MIGAFLIFIVTMFNRFMIRSDSSSSSSSSSDSDLDSDGEGGSDVEDLANIPTTSIQEKESSER